MTGLSKGTACSLAAGGVNGGAFAPGRSVLETIATKLSAIGLEQVVGVVADFTKASHTTHLVDETVRRFCTLHLLVNSAGGIDSFSSFVEVGNDNWQALFDRNILSVVRTIRAALPYMPRQKWGHIINIASESGIQLDAFIPHYNATKAGLTNVTKSLSEAFAADGIPVNAVSPALIMTPLPQAAVKRLVREAKTSFQKAAQRIQADLRRRIEPKRTGRITEVAVSSPISHRKRRCSLLGPICALTAIRPLQFEIDEKDVGGCYNCGPL